MTAQKAFTLVEIIIVLIIIGILTAVALPSFMISIEQTRAQTAQNNLLAIAAGQGKYYEDYGHYYYSSQANDITGINSSLNLSMSQNDQFTYSCGGANPVYNCTAGDGTVTLMLISNPQPPGSLGCPAGCVGGPGFTSACCNIYCFDNSNGKNCPAKVS